MKLKKLLIEKFNDYNDIVYDFNDSVTMLNMDESDGNIMYNALKYAFCEDVGGLEEEDAIVSVTFENIVFTRKSLENCEYFVMNKKKVSAREYVKAIRTRAYGRIANLDLYNGSQIFFDVKRLNGFERIVMNNAHSGCVLNVKNMLWKLNGNSCFDVDIADSFLTNPEDPHGEGYYYDNELSDTQRLVKKIYMISQIYDGLIVFHNVKRLYDAEDVKICLLKLFETTKNDAQIIFID